MKVLISALLLLLTGCIKVGPVNIDTSMILLVRDSSGTDLLHPTTGKYNASGINVYYLKEGEKQQVYFPHLDAPKGFRIRENELKKNEYLLVLFPYDDLPLSTTIIQWGQADFDTITCEITHEGSSRYCTKIWYNQELKWDVKTALANYDPNNGRSDRWFEVVK